MKVLQLCKKVPYPLTDGESVVVHHLTKGLVDTGCDIDLLALNTSKHWYDVEVLQGKGLEHYCDYSLVDLDNKLSLRALVANLFSKEAFQISRFNSVDFSEVLKKYLQLNTYDVVLLETAFMAVYLPIIKKYSSAKVVLRSHNVEFDILKGVALESSFFKRRYMLMQARRLKTFEVKMMQSFDLTAFITSADALRYQSLGCKGASIVIPVALPAPKSLEVKVAQDKYVVGFIGSLDWAPNVDGIVRFIKEIWLPFQSEYPNVELRIAGKKCSDTIKALESYPNVVVYGEVESAAQFVSACDVSVVPLWSGSGMRVKIVESLSLGVPVLSTALGRAGVEDSPAIIDFDDLATFELGFKKLLEMDYTAIAQGIVRDHYNATYLSEKLYKRLDKL